MERKKYSKILAAASCCQVKELAELVTADHNVKSLRPPQKTLTMIQMKDPIASTRFYLGEALCSECMVEMDGVRGFSVMMGDDFEKVTAAAVIDAAFRADIPLARELEVRICKLELEQKKARAGFNGEILKSRVNFNTMGGS